MGDKIPRIEHKGKKYYVVGCRKCNSENQAWILGFREKSMRFIICCPFCGHIEKLQIEKVKHD